VIFRPVLAEAVMTGHKTVTRRPVSDNPRSPYHPSRIGYMIGAKRAVCPGRGKPAIGTARVTSVRREQLEPFHLHDEEIRREGFNSRSAWLGAWVSMHNSFDPVDVWVIGLRPLP
jgi:hypothetical protein